MKILYLDCTGGVSGDMMMDVLAKLGGCSEEIKKKTGDIVFDHGHDHGHGRSYETVRRLIEESGFSEAARNTACKIYSYIAEAEAKVHDSTLETVHFHEVGRDEAVKNALGIGMALEVIAPDRVEVSPIYDGSGTVVCSHGEIPVPVPAVMALRENCSYRFMTADVDTEMVTPSGLAAVMGIDAVNGHMRGKVKAEAEAAGGRDTGRDGLKGYIIETEEDRSDVTE